MGACPCGYVRVCVFGCACGWLVGWLSGRLGVCVVAGCGAVSWLSVCGCRVLLCVVVLSVWCCVPGVGSFGLACVGVCYGLVVADHWRC